ncbi:MAG: tyrosine-type recombinase/integrase [Pseudonocardiaceae bacterium]|nr:tyrosine-type recombinase/integrase [Pseudonocardiaceae bacterium]
MGHVQDRWWKEVGKDERGRPLRVKTDLFGKGLRYKVRYLDPNGQERSKSFPDRQKGAAEAFLHEVETDKNKGTYLDPTAGRIIFQRFAEKWLDAQTFAESTREGVEGRLAKHVYPHFGDMELRAIGPATIQAWGRRLQQHGLAETYRRTLFANVSGIFTAAVDDERLRRNLCVGKSVTRPRGEYPKVVPWPAERVHAVRGELGERYRITVDLGAGCGLRQGEVIGLSADQVDFGNRVVQIIRQVKIVRSRLVFGPPKHGKSREVPLPDSVAGALRDHIHRFEPLAVTLPWQEPDGEPVTVRLLVWTRERGAVNRNFFNHHVWKPALRRAGVPVPRRAEGFHALRHFYASVLLDGGESIKALSEYLGHADPGFTLRTYTHLMPSSSERTRRAVDSVFRAVDPEHAEGPESPPKDEDSGPPTAC